MKSPLTYADYEVAFKRGLDQEADSADILEFENDCDSDITPERLHDIARVLACPVKVNPPNWQHGRVIYAAMVKRARVGIGPMYCLDIGTAKGFSAICAATAGASAGRIGVVHTVDVIPPESRAARNAPTDLVFTRPTLPELIADMATGKMPGWEIHSYCDTGIGFLNTIPDHIRIDFAFVDGKHRHDVVHAELSAIAAHQRRDDVIVVDDVQLAEVHAGLKAFLGTPAGACYRARTMHGGFKVIGVLERVV